MIESLLALLAGRGDEADFHDRYAQGLAAVVRAELALVVDCTEGRPAAVLGSFGDGPAVQALFEALPPSLLSGARQQGYAHDAWRRSDGMGLVLLAVGLLDEVPSVVVMALPERERAHLKEALIRAMLVKDVRDRKSTRLNSSHQCGM
jgi:hypothetical protein